MLHFLKKRAKKAPRDLEQVIFDIAEHNRDEDLHLFYRLMSQREVYVPVDGAPLPAAAEPGVPYTTRPTDQLRARSVFMQGRGELLAAATQTSHPLLEGGHVGMPWLGFLEMAQKIPEAQGVLIQGRTSWIALDQEHIAYVLHYSRGLPAVNGGPAPPDHVTVPPGHKVVIIHPSTQPQVIPLESNFLVLDFGLASDWQTLVSDFDERLSLTEVRPVVAILQGAMLDRLRAAGDLRDFAAAWHGLRERGWQAVWVLPLEAAGQTDAVELLKAAGFGVHGSAEDGACFVEVHKPDGTITIGMPGPSL
ncbi:MAG TPA: hypothetical protein VF588_12320 [Pyrinomonadaceae bacterium]|jgi:hypothetical protein